jgi:glyoxylase-like metal-dependent hydrolase (beta-lactamase superfamily II)
MPALRHIPLAYNNVYLIEDAGERLLIDTGPDYSGAWEHLNASLTSGQPSAVVATHGHNDHAGLGAKWQAAGVPVGIGTPDIPLARHPLFEPPGRFQAFLRFVEESGAPALELAAAIDSLNAWRARTEQAAADSSYSPLGRGARWPTALRFQPYTPALSLEDGDIPAGLATILRTPGHTPGNLVAVVPSEGWLFSGDQLLPDLTPTPAVQADPAWDGVSPDWRFRSLPAFVHSLRRLATLDFSICYPGHGKPFTNVAHVIAENLTQVEARTERVWDELRTGGPVTLYTLAHRLYPRALQRRFWQIIPTIQGHLDLLEDDHRVALIDGQYHART